MKIHAYLLLNQPHRIDKIPHNFRPYYHRIPPLSTYVRFNLTLEQTLGRIELITVFKDNKLSYAHSKFNKDQNLLVNAVGSYLSVITSHKLPDSFGRFINTTIPHNHPAFKYAYNPQDYTNLP